MRWEYGSPPTELYGRLVNLDIAPGYSTADAQVLGSDPVGAVTGQKYPDSLIRPDRHAFQPRFGIAWRPFFGSSVIVPRLLWRLLQHDGVQFLRESDVDAIAVLQKLHRGQLRRHAADAGQRL
jgi:hypothetical protein